VNIERISYDRKATSGRGILIVDVIVQQIREQSAGAAGQASQTPSGAAPQDNGNVQPQVDTSGVTADEAQRGVL
jgi:hypothetical protein